MKEERVFNIRFLFCIFIGLMIGIIISKLFLIDVIKWWVGVIIFLLILAISIFMYVYGYRTKQKNAKTKYRRNVSKLLMFSGVGVVFAVIIGVIISIIPFSKIITISNYDNKNLVSGVVCDYINNEETYNKFIIDDCTIIYNNEIHELDYKVIVYTDTYADLDLGDKISFDAELDTFQPDNGYEFNSIINGIGYSVYVSSSDINFDGNNISIRDYIHNQVYDLLHKYLNKDNANICYSILFGQKENLDEGISDMFSYAGISHILAVSGLHIGVLVTIIWFLLKRIKINKYLKLSVFATILFGYAYLCYFSPSVCRASIMAFILALCKCNHWEYDALSALSLAGIIILIIEPYKLFSISFQLSFMCIFSIITFAPSIELLLKKIKCPKILSSTLAVSIALNIAILPIIINSFAKVSLLGVFANIFVLPLFSIVYVLLFAVVLLGVIIKPLGILLAIPNMFLHIIKVVANYVSQIPFGIFKVFNVTYILIALIILTTVILHYLMTKHFIKRLSVITLTLLVIIIFGINSIPKSYNDVIIVPKQYNSNLILAISDDEISLIGSDITYKNILFIMKEARLNKIDNIYAYDLSLNSTSELKKIIEEYSVDNIFIPQRYDYNEIKEELFDAKVMESEMLIKNITMQLIEYDDEIIAIEVHSDKTSILIPSINNNSTENRYLRNNYLNTKYLIVNYYEDWKKLINFSGLIHNFSDDMIIIEG